MFPPTSHQFDSEIDSGNFGNSLNSRSHQHHPLGSYTDKKSPRNNPKLTLLHNNNNLQGGSLVAKHIRNKSDAKLLKNFNNQDQISRVYGGPNTFDMKE
jgi:hypothetical protein